MDGLSAGLSGEADKQVFRLLRRNCDALLVGAGTFRSENYRPLTLDEERRSWRIGQGLTRYPRLVVVSKSLDLDPDHPALAQAPVRAMVLTTGDAPAGRLSEVVDVVRIKTLAEGIACLNALGLTQVLCEGGPQLFGALTKEDLVDEICLTLSPLLSGPGAGRIIDGEPHPPRAWTLGHANTAEDGTVLLRYERLRGS